MHRFALASKMLCLVLHLGSCCVSGIMGVMWVYTLVRTQCGWAWFGDSRCPITNIFITLSNQIMTFLVWSEASVQQTSASLSLLSRTGDASSFQPLEPDSGQGRKHAFLSTPLTLQPPAVTKILPENCWSRQRNSQSRPDQWGVEWGVGGGRHRQSTPGRQPSTWARDECSCPKPQSEYSQHRDSRTLAMRLCWGQK